MDAVEIQIEDVGSVVLTRNGELWRGQDIIGHRDHNGEWSYIYTFSVEPLLQDKLEEAFSQLIG